MISVGSTLYAPEALLLSTNGSVTDPCCGEKKYHPRWTEEIIITIEQINWPNLVINPEKLILSNP